MAREAGVAQNTMLKCLAGFEKDGLVVKKQRTGIHVRSVMAESGAASISQPRTRVCRTDARRVTAAIHREILDGTHPAGATLPGMKELSFHYGLSYRTLKRALDSLVNEGLLLRVFRKYRVAQLGPSRTSGNTIVLIGRGEPSGELLQTTARTWDHLAFLERLCSRFSVRLLVHPIHFKGGFAAGVAELIRIMKEPAFADDVLGLFVWNSGLQAGHFGDCMRAIQPMRKRTALLDEEGERHIKDVPYGSATRVYSLAVDRRPGIHVARYLLALGHRCVAFIDDGERREYSMKRFEGLREEFGRSGGDSVVEHVVPDMNVGQDLLPRFQEIYWRVDALPDPPGYGTQAGSAGTYKTPQEHRHKHDLLNAVYRASQQHSLRARIAPALGQLLQRTGITAWVTCGDQVAVAALDFLRTRKVAVPRHISVMGFDDGALARTHGITTFNFNGNALLHRGFLHLLGARTGRERNRDGTTTTNGFVVERRTTAAVPRARAKRV